MTMTDNYHDANDQWKPDPAQQLTKKSCGQLVLCIEKTAPIQWTKWPDGCEEWWQWLLKIIDIIINEEIIEIEANEGVIGNMDIIIIEYWNCEGQTWYWK